MTSHDRLSVTLNPTYGIHRVEYYTTDRLNNSNNVDSINVVVAKTFNVKNYGARGDGVTDDTQAIRNAIEAARQWSIANNNNQLVAVYFPTGIYLTGQLVIHSNMAFIGDGRSRTILKRYVPIPYYFKPFPYADTNSMNDPTGVFGYPPVPQSISSGHISLYYRPFIKNYNIMSGNTNIILKGLTIDGNGYKFEPDTVESGSSVIHNVLLQRVNGAYIEDLAVNDAHNFHFHTRMSSNITIKSLYINGNASGKWGTTEVISGRSITHTPIYQDGFHAKGCNDINADYIHTIFSGDDAITVNSAVITSTLHVPSYNVYIKTAIVNSRLASGMSLHTHGQKDVYNIRVDELIVNGYGGDSWDSTALRIMHWHNDATGNTGTPRDITIGRMVIRSLGYVEKDSVPFIHIYRGNNVDPSIRPRNITIGEVILMLDGSREAVNSSPIAFFNRRGIRLADCENVQINRIRLEKMPAPRGSAVVTYDMIIENSRFVTVKDTIIRKMVGGSYTHIRINNSQNCTLDGINIPKIDTNNDGIPDSNQGGLGLSITGASQYLTVTGAFATTTLYRYDDTTAIQYQNTNLINIQRV
ncbi:hypothetical protein HRbin05_00133 [archaeon HR05]|nr:hypothetical protein HRbin05_00133 [archaeon HR05]